MERKPQLAAATGASAAQKHPAAAKASHRKSEQYQVTAGEAAAIGRWNERSRAVGPTSRIQLETKGNDCTLLSNNHPVPELGLFLLTEALGTASTTFSQVLIGQLRNAVSVGGKVDEANLNFAVDAIKANRPRDEIEAMLLCQMLAVHLATMRAAAQLRQAQMIIEHECAASALTKLTRTYALQTEALNRYRAGAEQKASVRRGSNEQTKRDAAARATPNDRAPSQSKSNGKLASPKPGSAPRARSQKKIAALTTH